MKRVILFALVLFLCCEQAYAQSVTATVTAENNYTTAISPTSKNDPTTPGHLALSVSGTWVATVTLQRSFDTGSNWVDVETYTANTEKNIYDPTAGVLYRAGVKTGDFTSGSVSLRLSK